MFGSMVSPPLADYKFEVMVFHCAGKDEGEQRSRFVRKVSCFDVVTSMALSHGVKVV